MSGERDYLRAYLTVAPVSLALERAIECRQLARYLEDVPADNSNKFLDLGCGDGIFGSILWGLEPIAMGVDLDEGELLCARESGAYRNLLAADAAALPFAEGSLATILSNSVLEHIPDLDPVFREACRVLRPGGRLIVTVPTPRYESSFFWTRALTALRLENLAAWYRRTLNRIFKHYHTDSADQWKERLERAGFAIADGHYYLTESVVSLDDLLYPFGLIGKLSKRLFGRWILFPAWRRNVAAPVLACLLRNLYRSDPEDEGGYILIEALKR
jgi:SAM-dependent methyltransferase